MKTKYNIYYGADIKNILSEIIKIMCLTMDFNIKIKFTCTKNGANIYQIQTTIQLAPNPQTKSWTFSKQKGRKNRYWGMYLLND